MTAATTVRHPVWRHLPPTASEGQECSISSDVALITMYIRPCLEMVLLGLGSEQLLGPKFVIAASLLHQSSISPNENPQIQEVVSLF